MKNIFLLILSILVSVVTFAQKNNNIVFTVGDQSITEGEFMHVYNKNLEVVKDDDQKDIDVYLQNFINYKLKVLEAYKLGYDQKASYIKEFNNYKKELTANYLTDNETSEKLLHEAYERLQKEINAKHILIKVDENANPADTLIAYNKISELREKAIAEGFDKVMKEVHNGKDVFGEPLGYFSVLQMVYPFENAAYNTAIGEISKPFRTQFGYHIIHVNDIRINEGQVIVAHIMTSKQKQLSDPTYNAHERINEIAAKLSQGEVFEDLAKKYSDDTPSAIKGGYLPSFSKGDLKSKLFEDKSFEMDENQVSAPFETEFGWHILKIVKKHPIGDFKEERNSLAVKISKDSRSKYITKAFIEKLKKQYNFIENSEVKNELFDLLNDSFLDGKWQKPLYHEVLIKTLASIGKSELQVESFADYLMLSQQMIHNTESVEAAFARFYNDYIEKNLLNYHEKNLININPEYAFTLKEYEEGLLIFDLMQEKIWSIINSDTLALKEFYETNKENYRWNTRANVLEANCTNLKTAKQVKKLLKKEKGIDKIKSKFNTKNNVQVMFSDAVSYSGNKMKFVCKEGSITIVNDNNGHYKVVKINKCLPTGLKTYDEAKIDIMNDYQSSIEKEWIDNIKKQYPVKINYEVLNKIKKEYKN